MINSNDEWLTGFVIALDSPKNFAQPLVDVLAETQRTVIRLRFNILLAWQVKSSESYLV